MYYYSQTYGVGYPFIDEQSVFNQALSNFHNFLNHLRHSGVPLHEIDRIGENLQYFINIGHEPTISDLLENQNLKGLFGPTKKTLISVAATSAGIPPELLQIIASILPKDFIKNTFGAVFANGLDFSCWNSSSNPTKQKARIETAAQEVEAIFSSLNDTNIEDILNELSRRVTYEWQSFENSIKRRDWARCTEKAWKLHIDFFKKMETDVVFALVKRLIDQGYIIKKKRVSVSEQSLENLYRDYISNKNTTAEKNGNIIYTKYTVRPPKPKQKNNFGINAKNINAKINSKQASLMPLGLILVASVIGAMVVGKKEIIK